jgi:lipoate---protein ligase
MKLCDLSFLSPEQNLACDEALLEASEQGNQAEVLRLWEPGRYFVVVGFANRVAREVNTEFCQTRAIPILRRCTGGGTILQGPGCLNYSLVLRIAETGSTRNITSTNEFVMGKHAELLSSMLERRVEACGHTDLALDSLKFSGNAQRRRKRFLLFHGCFLLNMDLPLISRALPMPSRQPDYRVNRSHTDFVRNAPVSAAELKGALAKCWNVSEALGAVPCDLIERLVRDRYKDPGWNFRF